jgi:putative sporulation protein YyaC
MLPVRVNYQDENAAKELGAALSEFLNKDTVIVTIGTDKCIGDALSPIVGTFLKKNKFSFPVYGSLDKPTHALTLEKVLGEIKLKHPHADIIGIDACLGYDGCVGEIQLKNGSINPGKGVGKKLPPVGNISIVGVVDTIDNADLFGIKNIRLNMVMQMAEVITKALLIAEDIYLINKKEVAVSNY